MMNIWKILQIEKTTNTADIRRAYAQMSKVYHPEREPEKFQELYKAYQEALKYANTYQDDVDDFWGDDEDTDEYAGQSDEESTQSGSFKQAVFNHKFVGLKENLQQESEDNEWENHSFGDMLYTHVSSEIKEGLNVFREYFLQQGPKDWRVFFTTPSFLRVQYEEQFAELLATFFMEQRVYAPERLPFELVREFFFAYDAFMEERGEELFDDGFTKLFNLLFANERIELVLDHLEDEKYLNYHAKYYIYYSIYKRVILEMDTQSTDIWEFHMSEINRVSYGKGENKRLRDDLLYVMLAFIIAEAEVFSKEVYEYLIRRLDLANIKNTTRWEVLSPIYQAIEGKGIKIKSFEAKNNSRPEQIRNLMAEIENLKKSQLTEEDRKRVRAFLEGKTYSKFALDHEFLMQNLYVYCVKEHMWPQIFVEEYVAYYDKLYEKTDSLEGREVYHLMRSRIKEQSMVGSGYTEITENQKEWVMQYFFEEGFTRVWKSSSQSAMKTVYREILINHMENLAQEQNYEWDLWDDGHLYAVKDGRNYVFMYDKINEKAILSMEEYWSILEELLKVFTGRYFCLSSDKNKWAELLERARKNIWQS